MDSSSAEHDTIDLTDVSYQNFDLAMKHGIALNRTHVHTYGKLEPKRGAQSMGLVDYPGYWSVPIRMRGDPYEGEFRAL